MSDLVYRSLSYHPLHEAPLAVLERLAPAPCRPARFVELNPVLSWFRSASYRVASLHGGLEIASGPTYCDVHGAFSGAIDAIIEARRYAERYAVNAESSLRVELLMTVRDEPVILGETARGRAVRTGRAPPLEWYHRPDDFDAEAANRLLAAPERAADVIERLCRVVPVCVTRDAVIWSSADSEVEALSRQAAIDTARAMPFRSAVHAGQTADTC